MPVPLRLITAEFPDEELLAMVNCPVAAPATVGSNSTLSVKDWPWVNVIGNVAPVTVKDVPVNVAALAVTGEVPVEVNVIELVAVVFSATLPNDTLVVLIARVGVAG